MVSDEWTDGISPPVRSPSSEESPALLGERSDYPNPFGEDPGDVRDPDR